MLSVFVVLSVSVESAMESQMRVNDVFRCVFERNYFLEHPTAACPRSVVIRRQPASVRRRVVREQ